MADFVQALVCAAILDGEKDFERLLKKQLWEVRTEQRPEGATVAANRLTAFAVRELRSRGLAELCDSGFILTPAGIELADRLMPTGR